MSATERIQRRTERLESAGLKDAQDDCYWARPLDLEGVGTLYHAEEREGRLKVEIRSSTVTLYLDTTNIAAFGDLHNLKGQLLNSRVSFSGNLRSITERGVRFGRLVVEAASAPEDRVVFTPKTRLGGRIILGEGSISDPGASWDKFQLAVPQSCKGLSLIPCEGE